MSNRLANLVECYQTLDLPVGARPKELKRTYRELMKLWHPDVCQESPQQAEEQAKSINVAFSSLISLTPQDLEAVVSFHRSATRRARSRRPGPTGGAPSTPRRTHRPPSEAGGPLEVRRRKTPAGNTPPWRRRGRDVLGTVQISPRESMVGARWKFLVATCRRCGGWGADIQTEFMVCTCCRGLGFQGVDSVDSARQLAICPSCSGRGGFCTQACQACDGTGESTSYAVACKVPPGVAENQCGVLKGLGHPGVSGGLPGDLFLILVESGE